MFKLPQIKLQMLIDKPANYKPVKINNTKDIDSFCEELKHEPEENLLVFHLNTQNEVIGVQKVATGVLDGVPVHPREVFKSALLSNAKSIIAVHNHVSGSSVEPSWSDMENTRALVKAGRLMDIEVLDHIIVGDRQKPYSFRKDRTDIWD